jgi:hypothetical protein
MICGSYPDTCNHHAKVDGEAISLQVAYITAQSVAGHVINTTKYLMLVGKSTELDNFVIKPTKSA